MEDLILHEMHFSGNCYKIRLTAAMLGLKFKQLIHYDVLKGETRTPEYLSRVNSNGRVPVLQIGESTFLPESNAACFYLADGSSLIPSDRLGRAEMLQWMFFEQYSHEPYVATLRFWLLRVGVDKLSEEQRVSLPGKYKQGNAALDVMNTHLATREFMAAGRMTLADIALYAYTDQARKMQPPIFDMTRYPHVDAWCDRIAEQPGYISIEQ